MSDYLKLFEVPRMIKIADLRTGAVIRPWSCGCKTRIIESKIVHHAGVFDYAALTSACDTSACVKKHKALGRSTAIWQERADREIAVFSGQDDE